MRGGGTTMLPPRPAARPPRQSIGDVVLRGRRLSARGARPSARRREGRQTTPARGSSSPHAAGPRVHRPRRRAPCQVRGTRSSPPRGPQRRRRAPPPGPPRGLVPRATSRAPPSRAASDEPREGGKNAVAPRQRRHVAGEQGEAPPFRLPVTAEPGKAGGAPSAARDGRRQRRRGEAGIFC